MCQLYLLESKYSICVCSLFMNIVVFFTLKERQTDSLLPLLGFRFFVNRYDEFFDFLKISVTSCFLNLLSAHLLPIPCTHT